MTHNDTDAKEKPGLAPGFLCVLPAPLCGAPKWIQAAGLAVHHRTSKAVVSKLASKSGAPDPLFAINLAFAKLRNDLARLGRKTWTTTKTIKGLENHLWLWVAWTNGYRLD